ncbi:hypothetical protein BDR03DRAFT_391347 [Suillus americanus]|nr:hypothetical protein BDR03DRAFT_391347 [Suillus americanus]
MNLGVRDAVFLGEALIKHINACASQPSSVDADYILCEFAEERHKRALSEDIMVVPNLGYYCAGLGDVDWLQVWLHAGKDGVGDEWTGEKIVSIYCGYD